MMMNHAEMVNYLLEEYHDICNNIRIAYENDNINLANDLEHKRAYLFMLMNDMGIEIKQ